MPAKKTTRKKAPQKTKKRSVDTTTKKELIRVNGKLREVVTVHDQKGDMLHKMISPLMVEFYPRDVMQVIIGATLLAIPVAFTEEAWELAETLPLNNVLCILVLSLLFIAAFVYYNYYRKRMRNHWVEFFKRVFSTYIAAFLVVGLIMYLIQRLPLETDLILSFKRIVVIAFPASLSAAVADVIK